MGQVNAGKPLTLSLLRKFCLPRSIFTGSEAEQAEQRSEAESDSFAGETTSVSTNHLK
jgi:hypothetical protein